MQAPSPPHSPIRALLDERGISYIHFARRLGLQPWQFSRIERGQQAPPPTYYRDAALFLNVDEERLRPGQRGACRP